MNEKLFNSPSDVLNKSIIVSYYKAHLPFNKLFILSFLAGLYIAFAGYASSVASFSLINDSVLFSLGKIICGSVFSAGLVLVVITGGELFTGNCLMITGVIDRKISIRLMIRNLIIVYFGNFVGSFFLAMIIYGSGLLKMPSCVFGEYMVNIASSKINIGILESGMLGILCNVLVCLAVLLSYSASTTSGKILGIFIPIMVFVTSGFEHCVANMFYIPLGIISKYDFGYNLSTTVLSKLTISGFIFHNLLPVTIGNIIGGLLISEMYYICYHKKDQNYTKRI